MHTKAKEDLEKVAKSSKGKFNNENTLKKVIQTARKKTTYKEVYEKPLNVSHSYGKSIANSKTKNRSA